MAVSNVMFAVLTALVAVNFIFAEDNLLEPGDFAYDQDGNNNRGPNDKPPNQGNNHDQNGNNNHGPNKRPPNQGNDNDQDGNSDNEPDERPQNEENDNEEQQGRTFFLLSSLFANTATTCNYTRGSQYCLSCTQTVRCYSSNRGYARTCRGLRRYCNGGTCSFFPGSEC